MNTIDLLVVIIYVVGITAYGIWISRHTKTSDGFFLGGRKLKWWTMMGQAFGTGTHAEMPVAQTGASFSLGFSTIWYQWKNMLITPFYWLMAPWYRRSERTTIAEMVTDRYGRQMGMLYTIFALAFLIFVMGVMLQGAAKVIFVASGETWSPNHIVIAMTVAFMVYSYFGGLVAAANTEFIQSFLIIVLSFLLIPFGIHAVGGMTEMRHTLDPGFFTLYSDASGLDVFTISMLAVNGVVGITAQPHMMTMFASGNTERAGRVGQTFGNLVKRLVTIGWALTGLIVAVLVIQRGTTLPDSEHAFGYAIRELLSPGITGLMIAAILAANMSSCSNFMVNLGSLFTRDIYQPYLRPEASDREILRVGRLSSLVLTLLGVFFALIIKNVLSAFLFVETMAAFVGISIFGGMLWRRANRYGAMAAILLAFVVYYGLNYSETGTLQLIYKWQPLPFCWAMSLGFLTLIIVSLLTPPEDATRIAPFFDRMQHLSRADRPSDLPVSAGSQGMEMILLDIPSWFKPGRWSHFWSRYREDAMGFLLAWLFVGGLIGLAWIMLAFWVN
ncbi:MAG: sodium:solute symporter family protein [Saprospiraceae bacterium]|nr:sodium:solute symporter family protein [Saprospiraceae bacterium]MCB9319826.1 sodium:solute symporter family protein [Lewinellaceae bacterium]